MKTVAWGWVSAAMPDLASPLTLRRNQLSRPQLSRNLKRFANASFNHRLTVGEDPTERQALIPARQLAVRALLLCLPSVGSAHCRIFFTCGIATRRPRHRTPSRYWLLLIEPG
jgi:hypothetical protein